MLQQLRSQHFARIFYRAVILLSGVLTLISCHPTVPLSIFSATHLSPANEPLYLADKLSYPSSQQLRFVVFSSASPVMQPFCHKSLEATTFMSDEAPFTRRDNIDTFVMLPLNISTGGGQPKR